MQNNQWFRSIQTNDFYQRLAGPMVLVDEFDYVPGLDHEEFGSSNKAQCV